MLLACTLVHIVAGAKAMSPCQITLSQFVEIVTKYGIFDEKSTIFMRFCNFSTPFAIISIYLGLVLRHL